MWRTGCRVLLYVQGTIRDICDVLAVDPSLEGKLDLRPLRGYLTPHWRNQVSVVLRAAQWAQHTGDKRGRCHVYRYRAVAP